MARPAEDYAGEIVAFTDKLLRPYLERLKAGQPNYSSKEINDVVWQTIVVKPFEVIFLDCPLLQRLRGLRQLGVVHWVYPVASHSRFEHSLGALQQVHRLVESLNDHCDAGPKIDPALLHLLRLGALCHDMGHGLMSHVSEHALKALGLTEDLLLDLAAFLDVERCSLSEAAAYFMLGAPVFSELIGFARERTGHSLPDTPAEKLQNLVIGKPISKRLPLLHELISGPFDADKLDYMTRDALMTGVPIVTDIPRLVQKLRLVELSEDKLPRDLARSIPGGEPSYLVQAVALSGARTIDELMLGRTLLYDKVYRHQKVRAAEAMVSAIVHQIAILSTNAHTLPLRLSDDDLLALRRETVSDTIGRPITDEEWAALSPARDLAERLRNRQLFVRAYAFSHSMPRDPFRDDETQRSGLNTLQSQLGNAASRKTVLDAVVSEIRAIKALVPTIAPAIPAAHLQFYVALDPPRMSEGHAEMARAFLTSGKQTIFRFREDSAASSGWSNAYLLTRDIGYVFSTAELAPATFLACEHVFRKLFGIRTPFSALSYSKIDEGQVKALREKLTTAGYYDGKPNDLRSIPARLGRADIGQRVSEIVDRLRLFEGLARPGQELGRPVRVTPERVFAWLRQFRTDDHVDAALHLLSRIELISRERIHEAIRRFMTSHPEFKGAYVCQFGSPKDSSAIVTYYASDVRAEFEFEIDHLPVALASSERPILFIDDFISSGGQARSIILTWLGLEAEAPVKEDRGPPLEVRLRDELKRRKLGFLFVCGQKEGAEELSGELKKRELDGVVVVDREAANLPCAFTGDFLPTPEKREAFKAHCATVGRALLKTGTGKARSDEWVAQRALGYGNLGFLIAFPYNTPTQTLTVLWCGGQIDGWQWQPLIPRRTKE